MTDVTVYTPASPLRYFRRFLLQMWRDLLVSRELGWRLFVRDTSAQYRQSLLGYLWVFIPPTVASLPFIYLRHQGIVSISATPVPYAVYAVIGTVIWQSFVDAMNAPLRTVATSKSMLVRINLPREAILLCAIMQVLFALGVRLLLVVAVFLWFAIIPAPTAPLALVGVFVLILFGFMIGLLLTPLGILYSDVQQIMPVATTFLMLLTPVLYPVPTSGTAATLASWNPLTPLVNATRDWLLVGPSPYALEMVAIAGTSFLLLLTGWIAFRVAMPHLIARIGN